MHFWRKHWWWLALWLVFSAVVAFGWMVQSAFIYGSATPLHKAVMKHDLNRVKQLIARGEKLDAKMNAHSPHTWDSTPLHIAAANGYLDIIDELIRAGADKNAVDRLGYTPLHRALDSQQGPAAKSLIAAGASVRKLPGKTDVDRELESPLSTALSRCDVTVVQAMVNAGADILEEVGPGAMGCVDGPDVRAKLQFLFDRRFSIEGKGRWDKRALHTAAVNNDVDAAKFLLDRGASTEVADESSHTTPFLAAASAGSNEVMMLLAQRGAKIDACDDSGNNAIYLASSCNKQETLRLLLLMKPAINVNTQRRGDKATPLHLAYWNNNKAIAQMLLDAGADPQARTTDGRLPSQFIR